MNILTIIWKLAEESKYFQTEQLSVISEKILSAQCFWNDIIEMVREFRLTCAVCGLDIYAKYVVYTSVTRRQVRDDIRYHFIYWLCICDVYNKFTATFCRKYTVQHPLHLYRWRAITSVLIGSNDR